MKVLLIVFLAGLAAKSSADVICKPVEAILKFSLKEFAGYWYEFKWYSNVENLIPWMFEKKCSKQLYEYVSEKPEQLFVTVTETNSKGNATILNGVAGRINDDVKNGDCQITMNKELDKLYLQTSKLVKSYQHIIRTFFPTYNYKVMAFKKGKYCIVYSCFLGIKSAVVLASVQHPPEADRKEIEAGILEAHKAGAPAPADYKEHTDKECK